MNEKHPQQGRRPKELVEGVDYVVIGREKARAAVAEERWKARGSPGRSPVPEGSYDYWRGETSLIKPALLPLDTALADLCQSFARADNEVRETARASISMDEFYTLIAFAARSAVFAVRLRSASWVSNGLTAVAMIDAERVDFRDVLRALSLLYHAAKRVGLDASQVLRDAGRLSGRGVEELIDGFIARSERQKDLQSSWGYDEVETVLGTGFIQRGFREYEPTYDLKAMAVEVADVVAADRYCPSGVEIATEFPRAWLEPKAGPSLLLAMATIRAVALVHSDLRPGEHPNHEAQMLLVFIVELASPGAARRLRQLANKKVGGDFLTIGLGEKRLFCLIVARSTAVGVEAFETQESLTRFVGPISNIIRRHTRGEPVDPARDPGATAGAGGRWLQGFLSWWNRRP